MCASCLQFKTFLGLPMKRRDEDFLKLRIELSSSSRQRVGYRILLFPLGDVSPVPAIRRSGSVSRPRPTLRRAPCKDSAARPQGRRPYKARPVRRCDVTDGWTAVSLAPFSRPTWCRLRGTSEERRSIFGRWPFLPPHQEPQVRCEISNQVTNSICFLSLSTQSHR